MTDTKHTPGPWEAIDISGDDPEWDAWEIWPVETTPEARPIGHSIGTAQPRIFGAANAALIAAAPETAADRDRLAEVNAGLVDALEQARAYIGMCAGSDPGAFQYIGRIDRALALKSARATPETDGRRVGCPGCGDEFWDKAAGGECDCGGTLIAFTDDPVWLGGRDR